MKIKLDKYETEQVFNTLRYLLTTPQAPGEHQIVTVDDVTLVMEVPHEA